MNALADKAHEQVMPHSDIHAITRPHYSTTIPTLVAANLTGVPLLLMWLHYGVHIIVWHSLHVLCQAVYSLIHCYFS